MEKYAVAKLVGEGSFGRVYRATNILTQETVALKVIGKHGRSSKEIKNLRGEWEIQAHLRHPNIIRMLDSFETNNEIVICTEFVHSDLHKLLAKEGSIGEVRARNLSFDLVSALYYLHSHRILHRDLKPQNILLDRECHAKLCDFGLARNMGMGTHVLTSVKGTPLYMAPELMNETPYDYRADLWSLGCIIYETLAGEPPFCTTSLRTLYLLIQNENIKWPSFLTEMGFSFLKGLLQKEPSLRMTWNQILDHPFVKGKITILEEDVADSPFTHPLTNSQNLEKERQKKQIMCFAGASNFHAHRTQYPDEPASSSRDSIKAMLQSDLENFETDNDNDDQNVPRPQGKPAGQHVKATDDVCYVTGNYNLIVNRLNDNLQYFSNQSRERKHKTRDLEKRKLSQNLDNFSLRLGKSSTTDPAVAAVNLDSTITNKLERSSDKQQISKFTTPPSMLPGWDSGIPDEYQSPPIENEEWLAFLHRYMQEILDGDIESLKQQNLVSIIVAPLRNYKASSKVLESVAQVLSLPLVLGGSLEETADIRNVYVEVKLVANLIYASKLLCTARQDCVESPSPTVSRSFRQLKLLSLTEVKTLVSMYELVCHLVHLNEQFLSQFCDSVEILGTTDLLVGFISQVSNEPSSIRLVNVVLALLCCALRELPENAELVEKIVFHANVDLVTLMKHPNNLLRSRMCMLLRMIGRFSCSSLQKVWSSVMRETLHGIATNDSSEWVRNEAADVLEEYKHLSFYAQY
ncbi:hypothetical protein HA402_007571 [Bradysia odoriphaga]|nr:hypothetical protein HA402_007571 [Bradysia odoriphaga]